MRKKLLYLAFITASVITCSLTLINNNIRINKVSAGTIIDCRGPKVNVCAEIFRQDGTKLATAYGDKVTIKTNTDSD